MATFPNLIRVCTTVGVALFVITGTSSLRAQTADKTAAMAAVTNPPVAHHDANVQPSQAHSVTLSWTASVPKSASSRDAITGYKVYRSTGQTPVERGKGDQIPCSFVSITRCVDKDVVLGQTYNYAVTSLTRNPTNNESELSKSITVTIH